LTEDLEVQFHFYCNKGWHFINTEIDKS